MPLTNLGNVFSSLLAVLRRPVDCFTLKPHPLTWSNLDLIFPPVTEHIPECSLTTDERFLSCTLSETGY